MSDDNDYEVGYCKPPRHSQFKPGQSGNPRGRPKSSKNMATVFADLLAQRIPVRVNGQRRSVPVMEALVQRMLAKALEGNARDMAAFMKLVQTYLPDTLKQPNYPHKIQLEIIESDGNGRPLHAWQRTPAQIEADRRSERAAEAMAPVHLEAIDDESDD